MQFRQRHPGDFGDLDVLVGEFTAEKAEEIVVHGLVDASTFGHEPVVDAAQRCQDSSLNAGFFFDLTHRGLFGGLTLLDMPLG